MTKYFNYPFSSTESNRIEVPDITQADGSVSYQAGFGLDYQKKLGQDANAKPVPRQGMNGLLYDITSALQQYQQNGFFPFITSDINGGNPYPYAMGATIAYDMSDIQDGSDTQLFISKKDTNTGNPKDDPDDWLNVTNPLMTEEELKEGESTEARAVSAQQLKSIIPPLMTEKELALGTSTEAKTVNAELLTSAFQKKIDSFAILYPNGGTATSPANISSNNRYILENPFIGRNVICLAEIQINGEWGNPGMIFVAEAGSTPGGRGVAANQMGDVIVVQSGSLGVCAYSISSGNPFGALKNYTTAPIRVLVWRV